MQIVNREELLNELESVQSGLSPKEIIEQSSCYVFEDGFVMTYNDEVACSRECCLKITGAIPAKEFTSILHKLKEDTIKVEEKENEIIIHGKRRRVGIVKEAEVLLPIKSIDRPEKWKKLDPEFSDAIKLVKKCVSKNEDQFALTCIHITPDHIESCDNFQIARFAVPTKIKKPLLVKQSGLSQVAVLDMTKFSITDSWIHFKNPTELVISCRIYLEDFPELDDILELDGSSVTLPKGLGDAADKASVFASDSLDDSQVLINLKTNKLMIKGSGASGWFKENKSIKYSGPDIKFLIAPDLLIEITKNYNDCLITDSRLMVDGGKFKYATCLGAV